MIEPTLAMAARAALKTHMDWHGATTLHPIGLVSLLVLGVWMLLASRKTALLPLMILICFIPSAQRIVIGGADFTLLRLMVLFALARGFVRGELASIRFNRSDLIVAAWTLVGAVVYVIQQGNASSIIYVCGISMDILGAYLVARSFVRTYADFRSFLSVTAALAVVVACFFVFENLTRRNLFSVFGGVPETTILREGRLRCQGAFSHAILAGVFWASFIPLFIGMFFSGERRVLFAAGSTAAFVIVVMSSSSTPLLGLVTALLFWVIWPFRGLVRYALIASPFVLTALHLSMKAPVWHLVSRVSAVGGSTGYHRFILIDGAIRHFGEWWLFGTRWTGHWSRDFQTWDITNQYIFEGVRGGILRLGLFLAIIFVSGTAIARAQGAPAAGRRRFAMWGLGGAFTVHCVCFIGVSYFGQICYLWYMTLAIAAASPAFFAEDRGRRRRPRQEAPRRESRDDAGFRLQAHP